MTLSVLKYVVIDLGGTLVLTLFFSTFLSIEKSLSLMPVIIGFNGLVLGYGLVEGLRSSISHYGMFSFIMGVGTGAAVFVGVKWMAPFAGSGLVPAMDDLVIYGIVSGVTSFLGARLAVRYFNL